MLIVGNTSRLRSLQPTAVRLIDGLERQALIERGAHEGRVTRLRLTEAGHFAAKELQGHRLAAIDGLLGALRPDERRLAMAIGVFCIYAVLVLLFHDSLQPFTILMALTLSLGGALLPLVVTGTSFSVPVRYRTR